MANLDNYLPCDEYTGKPDSKNFPGFLAWFQEADGHWYFSVVTNTGRVVLRSEGYTTEAGRNNGIESVIRNRDIEERYQVVQDETDGQWYLCLRSGNHQEIARSCGYASEAAARTGIAASFSSFEEKDARSPNRLIDNYLDCERYAAAPALEQYPGFRGWFDEGIGQWFIAVVLPDGRVVLRSEAYTSEAGRNNGIESVQRNRDLEERYKVLRDEADGQWYVSLRAGNHQEIARSCAYSNEAAALAGVAACFSNFGDKKDARGPIVIEDYLPCAAYADKQMSEHEGFTVFTDEKTGLHYFAMVGTNGEVILKSEGYTATSSRDNGIESVLQNRNIETRWLQGKDDSGHYMSLRAGNRQEIARTCHRDSEAALLAWWLPLLGGAAWAWRKKSNLSGMASDSSLESFASDSRAAAVPPVVDLSEKTPAVVPPPPPAPKVVYSKPVEAPVDAPPLTSYTNAPAASGADWWRWLLPLLLLAALCFLLWRGCGSCHNSTTTSLDPAVSGAPVLADTTKTKTADTVKVTPVPAPVVPKELICDCTNQTDPVFNLNQTREPKPLHYLGSNPEFGNSHGLTPTKFYEKLKRQHAQNAVDRTFLDRMFKAMGYADGFAAAKAEQFSAVEIPVGTVGNIGYSVRHKTLYARLDTEGKDLLAFRIKAANGCDLHFMKTCGNHFFFCPAPK